MQATARAHGLRRLMAFAREAGLSAEAILPASYSPSLC